MFEHFLNCNGRDKLKTLKVNIEFQGNTVGITMYVWQVFKILTQDSHYAWKNNITTLLTGVQPQDSFVDKSFKVYINSFMEEKQSSYGIMSDIFRKEIINKRKNIRDGVSSIVDTANKIMQEFKSFGVEKLDVKK